MSRSLGLMPNSMFVSHVECQICGVSTVKRHIVDSMKKN